MTLLVVFAPTFHGQMGLVDEVELCLTPIVIVVTLVLAHFLSRRAAHKSDRNVRHRRKNGRN